MHVIGTAELDLLRTFTYSYGPNRVNAREDQIDPLASGARLKWDRTGI